MIYEQKRMHLVGLKKTLWQDFLPRLKEIENVTGDYCYGVVILNENQTEYFCGVEVSSKSTIPNGMSEYTLPAATYAKFKHLGERNNIKRTVHSIYNKWLPLCEWKHGSGPDLEIYEFDYDPSSDDSYL